MPNCKDCIFCIEPRHYAESGENLGGPICGMGKGPLFMPTYNPGQNNALRDARAESCELYNTGDRESRVDPASIEKLNGVITMVPDPMALDRIDTTGEAAVLVRSCLQCRFYIPPETMVEHGLWNMGACAARGILLRRSSVVSTARRCPSRSIGPRDETSLSRMQLVPEYTMSTIGELTMAADFAREARATFSEPSTYASDAPVTDDERAAGIRAWRLVKDENERHEIMLPIFDPDFFSEEERAAIPRTGDDEHPEQYVDHMGLVYKTAVLWMALDETPALWGAAGTGKTEFFRHMAWLMCLPFHRISVTGSTEVDDLAGKMHYDPAKGTYFEYGRIPTAWGKPGVICLDEPNVGQPDVWQFIRPLTDNSKQLVLDMNKGERLPRHDYAFLGMAMNPAWDVRNSGTSTIADADGSRLMHIFVDLPSEAVERRIIEAAVKLDGWEIGGDALDMVIGIAGDLRRMSSEETIPITWGIRPQLKVARALKWFGPTDAYRLATADYLEPQHQELILDVVRSHARSSGMSSPRRRSTSTTVRTRERDDAHPLARPVHTTTTARSIRYTI